MVGLRQTSGLGLQSRTPSESVGSPVRKTLGFQTTLDWLVAPIPSCPDTLWSISLDRSFPSNYWDKFVKRKVRWHGGEGGGRAVAGPSRLGPLLPPGHPSPIKDLLLCDLGQGASQFAHLEMSMISTRPSHK